MDLLAQTYLSDILNIISQGLLVPAIIALLALILYGLWCIGSVVVEGVSERRHFKMVMPTFVDAITLAPPEEIPSIIASSGLLKSQRAVLDEIWNQRTLPTDTQIALAKRLIDEQDFKLNKVLSRNQAASKVAPMLGLMGTLIPLGPGIVSLGTGDTAQLSSSLLVAFDTTVAGLVVAIVTFLIARVRKNWYEDYMSALSNSMSAILEKIDIMRQNGEL